MPERYVRAMSKALWDTDLIGVRLLLFLGELLWAVMLLWPGETFNRATYELMASAMSEMAWTVVFLASAVTQITIILREDFSSAFARYFAAWNACLWLFTVASMLLSIYPPPAAIGGEIALALGAVWVWIRPYILAQGIKYALQTQKL